MSLTRRTMLKTSAAAAAATGLRLWGTSTAWAGASDRVRIAVIGIHGMGQNHIAAYNAIENVQVAALCDIDESLFDGVVQKHFTAKNLPKPKLYTDIRKLLEDKDIDAVSVVTPNHWHTLASIWSIQAGKHVSVEKPAATISSKAKNSSRPRAIQCPGAGWRRAAEQSRARNRPPSSCTKAVLARCICPRGCATSGGRQSAKRPTSPYRPAFITTCGRARRPSDPFNRNRFHYNWHWNWDYGNGDIGNQGVHEVDIARWMLGVTAHADLRDGRALHVRRRPDTRPTRSWPSSSSRTRSAAATRRRSCSSRSATGSATARTAF